MIIDATTSGPGVFLLDVSIAFSVLVIPDKKLFLCQNF